MPENAQLAERMRYVPDYSIPAPAIMAVIGKKMELYAGLVKNVDYHIGRLIYINRAIRRIIIIDLPVRELPAYSLRGEILILLRP